MLTGLNQMPDAFLYSCYTERLTEAVSDKRLGKAIAKLFHYMGDEGTEQHAPFLDYLRKGMEQHALLPEEEQEAVDSRIPSWPEVIASFIKDLEVSDMMMMVQVLGELQQEKEPVDEGGMTDVIDSSKNQLDQIASQLASSKVTLLIWLVVQSVITPQIVEHFRKGRSDSRRMASVFNKVLARVRKSKAFDHYWEGRRKTLRVVNSDTSWSNALLEEMKREKALLAKLPGDLFAKWMEQSDMFGEDFISAGLNDDQMRELVFRLVCVGELGHELNPVAKGGEEYHPANELQEVGEAVLEAVRKTDKYVENKWYARYHAFWQELIQNETIFAELKVTRNSPHNDHFTMRFFLNLVGEMKKMGVFKVCSDEDLAKELTTERYVGTFRKNINEGLNKRSDEIKKTFNTIYLKYKQLADGK